MTKTTFEELKARAEAKAYRRGAHKEEDKLRNRHQHVERVKRDHNWVLDRYVL